MTVPHHWKIALKALVSSGLLLLLLLNMDLARVAELWARIDLFWILACVGAMTASNLLGAVQWRMLLLGCGVSIGTARAINYYYIGLFFNHVLLSFVGGDLLRIYDITKESGDRKAALSTVFLDRLLGMAALVTLAVVFGLKYHDRLAGTGMIAPVLWMFLLFLGIGLFFYYKRFAKKFQYIGERLLPAPLVQHIRDFYNGVNYFRQRKGLLIRVGILSLMTQTLRVLSHYLAARALLIHLSVPLDIPVFFLFIPLIFVVTLLPVSIGGLGVREQTGVLLFATVGFTADQAFSMEFMTYVLGILAAVPGGALFILRKRPHIGAS